jgi:hypothetical protein
MALFPVLNVNRQHRQYVKKATVKSEGKKGSSPTPTIQHVVPTGASSGAAENALLVTKCVSVKLGDENDTTTDVSFIP